MIGSTATGSRRIVVNVICNAQGHYTIVDADSMHPDELAARYYTGSTSNPSLRPARSMMNAAYEEYKDPMMPHKLAMAVSHKGELLGAVSYRHHGGSRGSGTTEVGHLGSIADRGVGTSLMRHVLSRAEEEGNGIKFSSRDDSKLNNFYQRFGLHFRQSPGAGVTGSTSGHYEGGPDVVKSILDKRGRVNEGDRFKYEDRHAE